MAMSRHSSADTARQCHCHTISMTMLTRTVVMTITATTTTPVQQLDRLSHPPWAMHKPIAA